MIDLEAIAKDAAERVHKNGGCVPQLAFAPILFALQDALSTTPARAEAQDEGAAGYKAALIDDLRRYYNDCTPPQMEYAQSDGLAFALDTAIRLLSEAHPSPTPAADDDRVRIAVEALEPFAHIASHVGLPKDDTVHVTALDGQWIATVRREDFWNARQALAALKSEGK